MCLAAALTLIPAEINLSVRGSLAAAETLVTVEKHLMPEKVHLVASETLVSSVMHQKPMEVSLVTAGMLVPTEMHLRPEELRLLLLKCWWLLKCTLRLRRCTAATHSLLPQVHIHRYQCISICQAYLHRLRVHFCR